jgi:hypothetical protein
MQCLLNGRIVIMAGNGLGFAARLHAVAGGLRFFIPVRSLPAAIAATWSMRANENQILTELLKKLTKSGEGLGGNRKF